MKRVDQRHEVGAVQRPLSLKIAVQISTEKTNWRVSWILKKQLVLFCFRLLRFGMSFMATYSTQFFQTVSILKLSIKNECHFKTYLVPGIPSDPSSLNAGHPGGGLFCNNKQLLPSLVTWNFFKGRNHVSHSFVYLTILYSLPFT